MTRALRLVPALLATAALLLAGPIGSGSVAAAANGGQGSQLEREVDRLSPKQRTELEREVADGLARVGMNLDDPAVQARLADALGVPIPEIERVAASADSIGTSGVGDISMPIVFLFVAAALIFAPGVFKSIADTLFGGDEPSEVEGVKPF